MKGAFVANKYYNDSGIEYIYAALKKAFGNVPLKAEYPYAVSGGENDNRFDTEAGFVIFWDKDYFLAKALEQQGIRVFNNSDALETCDDKLKTYAALKGIRYPKTVPAPLMYDVNDQTDSRFLKLVADSLGFPVIVKENKGSQGRQVFKADNPEELAGLYTGLKHKPHHYQRLEGAYGKDLRVYVAGHKAVGAALREGEGFKANLYSGGKMSLIDLPGAYRDAAESISRQLGLDFGAVDFLIPEQPSGFVSGVEPVFLEANSNAYFRGIENLGCPIAERIAEYVLRTMGERGRA